MSLILQITLLKKQPGYGKVEKYKKIKSQKR